MPMAVVTFYAKPGCINNNRQRRLLLEAGHEVIVKDLLSEAWTPTRLEGFFGAAPVIEWFNVSAPRVKSGEVRPALLTRAQALSLMVQDPLLIRRPLMEANGRTEVGFGPDWVDAWLGLASLPDADLESCPRTHAAGTSDREEVDVP